MADSKKGWIDEQSKKGLLSAEEIRRKADELEAMGVLSSDDDVLMAASTTRAPPTSNAAEDSVRFAGKREDIRELTERDLARSRPDLTPEGRKTEADKEAAKYDFFPPSGAQSALYQYGNEAKGTAADSLARKAARAITAPIPLDNDRPGEPRAEYNARRKSDLLEEEMRLEAAARLSTAESKPTRAAEGAAEMKAKGLGRIEQDGASEGWSQFFAGTEEPLSIEQAREEGMLDEDGLLAKYLDAGVAFDVPGLGRVEIASDPQNTKPVVGLWQATTEALRDLRDSIPGMSMREEPEGRRTGAAVVRVGDEEFAVGSPWMVPMVDWVIEGEKYMPHALLRDSTRQGAAVMDAVERRRRGESIETLPVASDNPVTGALLTHTPLASAAVSALGAFGVISKAEARAMRADASRLTFRESFDGIIPMVRRMDRADETEKQAIREEIEAYLGSLTYDDLRAEARQGAPTAEAARRFAAGAPEGFERIQQAIDSGAEDAEIEGLLRKTPIRDLPEPMRAGVLPSVERVIDVARKVDARKEETGVNAFGGAVQDFGRHIGYTLDSSGRVVPSALGQLGRLTTVVPAAGAEANITMGDVQSVLTAGASEVVGDLVFAAAARLAPEAAERQREISTAISAIPIPTPAGLDYYFASGNADWIDGMIRAYYDGSKAMGAPESMYSWLEYVSAANYEPMWRTPNAGYFARVAAVVGSGDMALRYSEVARGLGVPEDSWVYQLALGSEVLAESAIDWENYVLGPAGVALNASRRYRAARRATMGRAPDGAPRSTVGDAGPRDPAAEAATSPDGVAAFSDAVRSNAEAVVYAGRLPTDLMTPDQRVRVREVIRGAGVDPGAVETAVRSVVETVGPARLRAMQELMDAGGPAIQALRATPEWAAVRAQMDDAISAGQMTRQQSDFAMAMLESEAANVAMDPNSGFATPAAVLGSVVVAINRKPGPNALYSGGEISSDPVTTILQEVLRATDERISEVGPAEVRPGVAGVDAPAGGGPVAADRPGADPAATAGAGPVRRGRVRLRGVAGVDGAAAVEGPTLDDLVRTSSAPNALENRGVTQSFYETMGATVVREADGAPVNTVDRLKLYDLSPLLRESYEATAAALAELAAQPGKLVSGWAFSIFGPEKQADGSFSGFRRADFSKSYDSKNIWLFNPEVGAGSFHDAAYTLVWRWAHEIAHGIVNDELSQRYGGNGRRAGALGIESVAPNGQTVPALTLADALRAVEWEYETFLMQRRILEEFGIRITDEQFAKENFVNMMDATYRSITGQFSDPGLLGVDPPAIPPAEMLHRAKEMLRARARELDLDMRETFYEQRGEAHPAGVRMPDQGLPSPGFLLEEEQLNLFPGIEGAGPEIGSVRPVGPSYSRTPVFHSQLRRVIEQKMPERLQRIEERRVPGRVTPERIIEVKGEKKVIPERREADKVVPGQTVAEQVRAILRDTDVKQDEIDWRGFDSWLEQKAGEDALTKAEVLKFLDESETKYIEDWRGPTAPADAARLVEVERELKDINREILGLEQVPNLSDEQQARYTELFTRRRPLLDEKQKLAATRRSARWSQYSMEGGSNHREMLGRVDDLDPEYFVDAHWGQTPNVVFHARVADYSVVGKDGAGKGLGLDENQSDLHQDGAKRGYAERGGGLSSGERQRLTDLINASNDLENASATDLGNRYYRQELLDLDEALAQESAVDRWSDRDWGDWEDDEGADWGPGDEEGSPAIPQYMTSPDAMYRIYHDGGQWYEVQRDGSRGWNTIATTQDLDDAKAIAHAASNIDGDLRYQRLDWQRDTESTLSEVDGSDALPPEAPFANTWSDLVMKRMLRFAAENGYDYLFWSPASVHTERWGTNGLFWRKDDQGRTQIQYHSQIGGGTDGFDFQAEADARGQNAKGWITVYGPEDIEGVLRRQGVEDQEAEHIVARFMRWSEDEVKAGKTSGAFFPRKSGFEFNYDQRIPRFVEKYIKRFDKAATVEPIRVLPNADAVVRPGFVGELPESPAAWIDARDGFPVGSPEWMAINRLADVRRTQGPEAVRAMFASNEPLNLDDPGVVSLGGVDWDAVAKALGGRYGMPRTDDVTGLRALGVRITPKLREALLSESQALYERKDAAGDAPRARGRDGAYTVPEVAERAKTQPVGKVVEAAFDLEIRRADPGYEAAMLSVVEDRVLEGMREGSTAALSEALRAADGVIASNGAYTATSKAAMAFQTRLRAVVARYVALAEAGPAALKFTGPASQLDWGKPQLSALVDRMVSMGVMSDATGVLARTLIDAFPDEMLARVRGSVEEGADPGVLGQARRAVEAGFALANSADNMLAAITIYLDRKARDVLDAAAKNPDLLGESTEQIIGRISKKWWAADESDLAVIGQRIADGEIGAADFMRMTAPLSPLARKDIGDRVLRYSVVALGPTGVVLTLMHETAHAIHSFVLGKSEQKIITDAYNRAREIGFEGETSYMRSTEIKEPGSPRSIAEFFAENFAEYAVFRKLPEIIKRLPNAKDVQKVFDSVLMRMRRYWAITKGRLPRLSKDWDPQLVGVMDRIFDGTARIVETPEEAARRIDIMDGFAPQFERADDLSLPVDEGRNTTVTVALTGFRPEFPDMEQAWSAYKNASRRATDLRVQAMEGGRDLTEYEQRVVARFEGEAKAAMERLYEQYVPDLQKALTEGVDPEKLRITNLDAGAPERAFGGWMGDPGEPPVYLTIEGDPEVIRGRLARFSIAYNQGGQLVRVNKGAVEGIGVFAGEIPGPALEQLIHVDADGRPRGATLSLRFPKEAMAPEVLDKLYGVLSRFSMGWTLAYERGMLQIAHTPEWSGQSPREFIEAANDLALAVSSHAKKFGFSVDVGWLREDIYVSEPAGRASGEYRVYGYDEQVTAGARAESAGVSAGPDGRVRTVGGGDAERAAAGPDPGDGAERAPAGRGDAAAEDAGLVRALTRDLGRHLDKVGSAPHAAVAAELKSRIELSGMPDVVKREVISRLRLDKVSPLNYVTRPVKARIGKSKKTVQLHLVRTDGRKALLPTAKILSFADLDYVGRRPVWLAPPFERPDAQLLADYQSAKADLERASTAKRPTKSAEDRLARARRPLEERSALWKEMGIPDELADELAGLSDSRTFTDAEADDFLSLLESEYRNSLIPVYDRHTQSLGIADKRPTPKLDAKGKPARDYLARLHVHLVDQLGIHIFALLSSGTNIVSNQLLAAAARPRSRVEIAKIAEAVRRMRAELGRQLTRDEARRVINFAITIGSKKADSIEFLTPDILRELGSVGDGVDWERVRQLNEDSTQAFILRMEERIAETDGKIAKKERAIFEARNPKKGSSKDDADLVRQLASLRAERERLISARQDAMQFVPTKRPGETGQLHAYTPVIEEGVPDVSHGDPTAVLDLIVDFDDDLRRVENGEQVYSWYEPHPDESTQEFVTRLQSTVRGMGSKIASFSVAMTMPSKAESAAVDTHMIKLLADELFEGNLDVLRRGWFEEWKAGRGRAEAGKDAPGAAAVAARQSMTYEEYVENTTNDWVTRIQDLLAPEERKTRPRGQALDPAARRAEAAQAREALTGAERSGLKGSQLAPFIAAVEETETRAQVHEWAMKWQERYGANPRLQSIVDGSYKSTNALYRRALSLIAKDADKTGLSLYTQQWLDWDQLRRYYEPELAVYAGAASVPGMGAAALVKLNRELSKAKLTTVMPSNSVLPKNRPYHGAQDQILLQMKRGEPTGAFEYDQKTNRYIIHLFQTGDFDTFLHENAHLLTVLMGQRWASELVQHFDSVDTPNGRVLTRRGHEEAAEALRWYFRTRLAPSGSMRAALDRLYLRVQAMWASLKTAGGGRGRSLLPPEMVTLWDTTLRPDLPAGAAATVSAAKTLKRFPTVRVEDTPEARIADGAPMRSGRAREASRVALRPEELRQELGLQAGQTQVDAIDVLVNAVAYVLTEDYRKLSKGEKLVRITTRSIVPESRLPVVHAAVRERVMAAIGVDPSGVTIENERVVLAPAQQAGFRLLVQEMAAEPLGNAIPDVLLDPATNFSRVPLDAYNGLLEVVVDVHAGRGARRARYVSEVPSSLGYQAWHAVRDGITNAAAVSDAVRKIQSEITETFKAKRIGDGYVDPRAMEIIEQHVRELGRVHEWMMGAVQRVQRVTPAATIGEILRGVRGQLTPPVAVPHVRTLLSLEEGFRTARESGIVTVQQLTSRLHEASAILQFRGGASAHELAALRILGVYDQLRRTNVQAAMQMLTQQDDAISDAVRVVHSGLRRRLQLVESRAHRIGQAVGGSADSNIMLNRTMQEKASLYLWFYTGEWTNILDWAAQVGRETGLETNRLPRYDSGTAFLEMLARFRADEILADLSRELARYGVDTRVDGLTADRALGTTDRDLYVERVKFYINNEISWDSSRQVTESGTVVRSPNAPESGMFPPAERDYSAPRDAIGNLHDLDAYTAAHEMMERWGFKYGKGEWAVYQFADGTEMLLPQMVIDELEAALDRAGNVGTAYGSAQSSDFGDKLGATIGVEPRRSARVKAAQAAGKVLDTLMGAFGMTFRMVNTGLTTGIIIPNPAYFIGNVVGAVFQTYSKLGLGGAILATKHAKLAGAVVSRLFGSGLFRPDVNPFIAPDGRIYTADSVTELVTRHGLKGSFLTAENAQSMARDIRDQEAGGWRRMMRYPKEWQKILRECGEATDNFFRVLVFLRGLEEGKSPAQAGAMARSALYDYSSLTEREKNVFRKVVLFYSFMRQNTNLFFDTLLTNPHRILAPIRLMRGVSATYMEEDHEIVTPEFFRDRLGLYFRSTAYNTHATSQVMTMAPQIPALAPISLIFNLFGALEGDPDATRGVIGMVHPMVQAPFVFRFERDMFGGRDLDSFNRVPPYLVEIDRQLGGVVTNDILRVQLRAERDPSRSEMYGERFYHAQNGRAWWVMRNLIQLPGAGRSMDTLAMADRANLGVVEAMVWAARQARSEAAGLGIAGPVYTDGRDTAGPRGEMGAGDELMSLLGFKTTVVPTREAAEDVLVEDQMRAMDEQIRKLKAGDPYKYEP